MSDEDANDEGSYISEEEVDSNSDGSEMVIIY